MALVISSRDHLMLSQDVIETILRVERLEDELKKSRQLASNLQIRLDGNTVEYRNEVQAVRLNHNH